MDGPGERWRWRPEPWWLMMALLGPVAGFVVGAGMLMGLSVVVADQDDQLAGLFLLGALGGGYGAMLGVLPGVVVGVVLMLVVGRDRPRRTARPLAFVVSAALTALVLGPLLPGLDDMTVEGFGLVLTCVSAVVAGLTAVWFSGLLPHRPRTVPGPGPAPH